MTLQARCKRVGHIPSSWFKKGFRAWICAMTTATTGICFAGYASSNLCLCRLFGSLAQTDARGWWHSAVILFLQQLLLLLLPVTIIMIMISTITIVAIITKIMMVNISAQLAGNMGHMRRDTGQGRDVLRLQDLNPKP